MAKKAAHTPWQDLEQQAVEAYREWHVWLVLREKELAARHTRRARPDTPGTAQAVKRNEGGT
jgi:hypothetical protein